MARRSRQTSTAPQPIAAPREVRSALVACGAGVGLTLLFWLPLWCGGGLVGGDVYTYSLPQKAYLADCLQRGVLPLWNPLAGHGYPVLGESQTGALYPLHLVAYGLWDIQTAWNVVLIAHYVAAFLATWWFARRSGLHNAGAILAATVYVYGWFPPRGFLDWAILGGVYLPLALGCAEGFLQSGRRRDAIGLSAALGLQLLGGHYQIAFYTWLTLAAYALLRLTRMRVDLPPPTSVRTHAPPSQPVPADAASAPSRGSRAAGLAVAVALGVLLGAVQLVPTWELKGRSQRADVGGEHDPAYGHIPPMYFTQLVAPWFWYDPLLDLDGALSRPSWGRIAAGTNRVEAHLYFGQLPTLLVLGALLAAARRRQGDGWFLGWLLIIGLSLLYATGWLLPVLQQLPGFGYFRGPGRAGIVATLGVGLLAGRALERIVARWSPRVAAPAALAAWALTAADLWWFPQAVSYAVPVSQPPIRARAASPVRKLLAAEGKEQAGPPRLYAPGPNLPTLLGVSATPVYLGLGPAEYFDARYTLPRVEPDDFHAFSPERLAWLRAVGVTHVLAFEPLERRGWPVELLWSGFDPLLNPAWARFQEPIFLYRLRAAPGRVRWQDAHGDAPAPMWRMSDESARADSSAAPWVHPHRVEVQVAEGGGRLVLTDLAYPGWTVSVNGQRAVALQEGMFRAVDVPAAAESRVVWTYRPAAVYWGAGLSLLAAACLLGWALFPARTRKSAAPAS